MKRLIRRSLVTMAVVSVATAFGIGMNALALYLVLPNLSLAESPWLIFAIFAGGAVCGILAGSWIDRLFASHS